MLASFFGLPISTTHTLVGSVTGIGLVRGSGIASLNKSTLYKIFGGWVVTILAGAVLTIVFFVILRIFL
jgi:PiT family inorganic phosphate transporter